MVQILLALQRGSALQRHSFFKRSVEPFLEEEVIKKGRKATVVYEAHLYPKVFFGATRPMDVRGLVPIKNTTQLPALQKLLSTIERTLNRLLAESLEKGMQSKGLPIAEGFEDVVIRANQSRPGSVRCIIEPQNAHAAYIDLKLHRLYEQIRNKGPSGRTISILTELIKLQATCQEFHSFGLLSLIQDAEKEDPQRVIVIPRGPGSDSLNVLLRKEGCNVLLKDDGCTPHFIDESVSRILTGGMSEEQLRRRIEIQVVYANTGAVGRHYSSIPPSS